MPANYLIVDGNSLGNFANSSNVLQLGSMQVQAIYGFLRTLKAQLMLYQNHTPLVVWDGASWRNMMFPDYKANREKTETVNEIKQMEAKLHYKKQVPYIKKALRFLGIPQIHAMNMEADDLAAIMTDRYVAQGSKVVLMTGDKDWLQLVGPNVVWRDFVNSRLITLAKFAEFTGVDTVEKFVQVKALAGDTGDNISGVGGVGTKGAIEFLNTYGSFANFLNMVSIEKTVDITTLPKKYRALIEDESKAIIFDRNIKLMDLRHPERPAPFNLTVDKGEPSYENFRHFCDLLLFKSITADLNLWISAFPHFRHLA